MVGSGVGLAECFPYDSVPTTPVPDLLDAGLHTMVIAWINERTVQNDDYVRWLATVWERADASQSRHMLILGLSNERIRQALHDRADDLKVSHLKNLQIKTWESSGEKAARPGVAALTFLESARELVTAGLKRGSAKLNLFISHAKLDGLSLANSLMHTIQQTPTLNKFYDAQDIQSGTNWQTALKNGVESSVLIAVRTNAYDTRGACIEEINWAEQVGSPIIVVDARSDFFYPPSASVMESSPWVLVPDGSLTRILVCTLRENLRLLLIRRAVASLGPAVDDATVVLSRPPSWISLGGAIQRNRNNSAKQKFIVYPDPTVSKMTGPVLNLFAQGLDAAVRVLAYNEFAALH
jgi:hypothetical protein